MERCFKCTLDEVFEEIDIVFSWMATEGGVMSVRMLSFIENDNFKYSLFSNVLAALAVSFLFFLLKDRVFKNPDLNGRFYLKLNVYETAFNPYKNMIMHFQLHFSTGNGIILGGGERVYEDAPNDKDGNFVKNYAGSSKFPMEISGNISKRIFGRDEIHLFCKVSGRPRPSTMVISLKKSNKWFVGDFEFAAGDFTWSVAQKSGVAFLSRREFFEKSPTLVAVKADKKPYRLRKIKSIK